MAKFEANGKAATEIGLPMNMILGQLPSGKVEIALQDLVPHFPAGYLQPTDSIASYLATMVNLPLMDVVMRIPPDLLALRPDQKDVDAAVINMADPFTEEILREQAESSRRQTQPNIIEESQVPQEEFVPQARAGIAPPRRPVAEPLIPSRLNVPSARVTPPPPTPSVVKPPPPMSSLRGSAPLPYPTVPAPAVRNPSATGSLLRATSVMPKGPQAPPTMSHDTATLPLPQTPAPVPPVPRHTGAIPAPPPPRHTTSLPVPRRTGALPSASQILPSVGGAIPSSSAHPAATSEKDSTAPASSELPSDNLARLAALAMAEMGDGDEADAETAVEAKEISAPAPAAKAEAPVPSPFPAVAPSKSQRLAPAPVRIPPPSSWHEAAAVPKSIPQPVAATSAPTPAAEPEDPAPASVAFNLNTCSADDLVKNIPDCTPELAAAIVEYRGRIGSFKRLEDLLDVPGITKAAYKNLTGEEPPTGRIPLSLNELLGYPVEQNISLKDVTDRIVCWPDVTGCLLSQSTGLSLVGTVPPGVNKEAVVAFAPRMFEAINKSFSEVSEGQDTDALVVPTSPTSFHLFRNKDLYLIIMSRLPQMPERHVKVARYVLAALSIRKD